MSWYNSAYEQIQREWAWRTKAITKYPTLENLDQLRDEKDEINHVYHQLVQWAESVDHASHH